VCGTLGGCRESWSEFVRRTITPRVESADAGPFLGAGTGATVHRPGPARSGYGRHSIQALLSAYRKRLSGYMQLVVYAVVAPDAIDAGLVPLAFVAVTVQV
jgi:hypothetical protein